MRFAGVCIILILFIVANCSFAVQKGGVQYAIPVDYSLINEKELNTEAENLFNKYLNSDSEEQQKQLLKQLLSDYSILGELDAENPLYFARLGIIFDKLRRDRWAKSNFERSANLGNNYAYAFYNYGNFYYDRSEYRKALKLYKKAFNSGYSNNYDTLYQMGIIYEKLGDYSTAIGYFKKAGSIKNSEQLQQRISRLEVMLQQNSLYDKSLKRGNY